MRHKNDMQAALECKTPTGAVPLWEIHFHCWEQASGRHFIGRPEFDRLTPAKQNKALARNAEIILQVAEQFHFAGVTIPDAPWDCFYTLPAEARLKLARLLRDQCGDRFMVVASCGGFLGMPGHSDTYVDFSLKLLTAPEEIDEMARRSLAGGIEMAKRLRDAGVEAVYSGADLADNRGPWFSRPHLERFVYPYMRQWAEEIHAMGLYAIIHTDGNVEPLLPDFIAAGVDALQAIDPIAGMDISRTKRAVAGRLCICGNVDCGLLVSGTPDQVYESTRRILEGCKDGGGFILGASNAVMLETPIENYRAQIQAWADHGAYAQPIIE